MPDFGVQLGSQEFNNASTPGSSTGITVTAAASTDTKNATYAELISTTTAPASWMAIEMFNNANERFLVDIAVGAASSEKVVIPNLIYDCQSTKALGMSYLFPVNIPAGSRVSATCQSSVLSATIEVAVHLFGGSMSSATHGGRIEAGGPNTTTTTGQTSSDPGATPNTDSTWTQLIASTGFPYRWVVLAFTNNGNTADTDGSNLVDLGIGAGGSEKMLVTDILVGRNSGGDNLAQTVHFPISVPSGSRLAFRQRCSHGTATDRIVTCCLYGAS